MKSVRFAFLMLGLLVVSACGNNGSQVSDSSQLGAGPTGSNVEIRSCQVGQLHNPQQGCLNRGTCPVGQGSLSNAATPNACLPGTLVTEQIKFGRQPTSRLFGRLTITNRSQFNQLLQSASLCNQPMAGFNAYLSNCDTLTGRGGFMILKAFGSQSNGGSINIQIGAGTQYPYDLIQSIPAGGTYATPYVANGAYRVFSQQARLLQYNGGSGMRIVGMNSTGSLVGLMALVDDGNLGSQRMQAQLMFQGNIVATVQLERY